MRTVTCQWIIRKQGKKTTTERCNEGLQLYPARSGEQAVVRTGMASRRE